MDIKTLSKKVSELEKRVEALEGSSRPTLPDGSLLPRTSKQMSAKEFLLSKNLSSSVKKTLALAYYLEFIRQISSFNIKDIADAFQVAKEKAPANLNDMINKNITKGYLMEAEEQKDSKKAWVLTVTGEKFVENNFKNKE